MTEPYEILQMLRLSSCTLLYIGGSVPPTAVLYYNDGPVKHLELPYGALDRMVSLDLIESHPILTEMAVDGWLTPLNHECRITQKGRLCLLDRGLFDRLWFLADAYLVEQARREREFERARSDALQAFRRAEQDAIDEAAKRHEFCGRAK